MDYNNGFSLSFFFNLFLSFLWIGAQFPQEKFLAFILCFFLFFFSFNQFSKPLREFWKSDPFFGLDIKKLPQELALF